MIEPSWLPLQGLKWAKPHTSEHVSSYYYMCPHTTIYSTFIAAAARLEVVKGADRTEARVSPDVC